MKFDKDGYKMLSKEEFVNRPGGPEEAVQSLMERKVKEAEDKKAKLEGLLKNDIENVKANITEGERQGDECGCRNGRNPSHECNDWCRANANAAC